ncbi:MAG TPA: hypothetical protein VMS00_09940 [Acidimicrobiales bacterium]|nr:hypothetical protein [Acidimicrobiales bacterium]
MSAVPCGELRALRGHDPKPQKLGEHGNIYVTGPGRIWVLSRERRHLGTIELPEIAGNFNWGDHDWKTLYVCASTSVYRIEMAVAGNRLGYML